MDKSSIKPPLSSSSRISSQSTMQKPAVVTTATPSFSHPSKQPSSLQEDEDKIYMALSACYDDYLLGNKTLMNKIVNEMSNRHKEKEQIRMWLKASTKKMIDLFKNKQDVSYLIEVMLYQMPWFEAGNEYEVGLRQEEERKQQEALLRLVSQDHLQSPSLHHQQPIGSSSSLFSSCSSSKRAQQQQQQQPSSSSTAVFNSSSSQSPVKPSPHFELFSELARFIMTLLSFSNAFAPQIIKFLVSNIVPMYRLLLHFLSSFSFIFFFPSLPHAIFSSHLDSNTRLVGEVQEFMNHICAA